MSVQVTKFSTHQDYCKTEVYQNWLKGWTPPSSLKIDKWCDSEMDLFSLARTPREYYANKCATRLAFHLIDQLNIDTKKTVDVGCGGNFFKKIYPNIWGVDMNGSAFDEKLTPDWYIDNWGKWSHAFAINSMHFFPQQQIPEQVKKIIGILQPNGTAFITLNRQRIKDFSDDQYNENKLLNDLQDIDKVTRIIWFNEPKEAFMEGNVWLFIKK
jgi:hypothetical protein